jgi:hypothetical protein
MIFSLGHLLRVADAYHPLLVGRLGNWVDVREVADAHFKAMTVRRSPFVLTLLYLTSHAHPSCPSLL